MRWEVERMRGIRDGEREGKQGGRGGVGKKRNKRDGSHHDLKVHVSERKPVSTRTGQAVQDTKIVTQGVPEVAPLDRESSVGSR